MKNYPLVAGYKNAILEPENFATRKSLEPCYLDSNKRNLYFATGGPAVVFKMKDTQDNTFHAVKCFLKEMPSRLKNFEHISNYLKSLGKNPYFVDYTYSENELWVEDGDFPALCMPWIEGKTLSVHIAKLCEANDRQSLRNIANKFDKMALFLLNQEMAHGDLKPDNIIVTEKNELMLVDYDGMYVPSLAGSKASELGTAEYRHPQRTSKDFSKHLDDFPILVLSLSLHALAENPSLYSKANGGDALLFKSEDYQDLSTFQHIDFFRENKNRILLSRFYMLTYSVNQPILELVGLKELLEETAGTTGANKTTSQEKPQEEVKPKQQQKLKTTQASSQNSTVQTSEISSEINVLFYSIVFFIGAIIMLLSFIDKNSTTNTSVQQVNNLQLPDFIWENSIKYNKDKTIVLDADENIKGHVTLPNSVTHIGNSAFLNCSSLQSIIIPNSVTHIGESAFSKCSSLQNITLPNSVTSIGESAFSWCKYLQSITIPNSVTHIGNNAFSFCSSLHSITIPNSVTSIGEGAFLNCSSLHSITIPNSVTSIGDGAFSHCLFLHSITIPNSVTHIGNHAFSFCSFLQSITIPNSVTYIGERAFYRTALSNQVKNNLKRKYGNNIFDMR